MNQDIQSFSEYAESLYEGKFLQTIISYVLEPTSEIYMQDITQQQYDDLFRMRHDTVLMTIQRSLEFKMDLRIQSFLDDHKININLSQINKNLTPDYILLKGNVLEIGEITIPRRPSNSYRNKKTKYAYLLFELSKHMEVDYKVSVFDDDGEPYIDEIGFPGHCKEIIFRFNLLINHFMRLRPELETVRLTKSDYIRDFTKINVEPEIEYSKDINDGDMQFVDFIVETIIHNPMKKTIEGIQYSDIYNDVKDMRSKYVIENPGAEDHKAILKFPYYKSTIIRNRNTADDETIIDNILPTLTELTGLGFKKWNNDQGKHLYHCHMTRQQHRILAYEGPGAKTYLSKEENVLRKQSQRGFIINPDADLRELTSFLSSSRAQSAEYKTIQDFESSNFMSIYLEQMELISREISINAMRKGRKKHFTVSPTDIEGVFLILYPGPPLRASEINSTVWFKLVSNKQIMFPTLTHRIVQKGEWNQTRWLSITSKKLDHYLRSKDQVLMAYYSHICLSGPLLDSLMKDTSNTLALMTLIWSEDLRQTSSTLHEFRYFIMQKLSIKPDFSKLKKKLKIPYRSLLLLHCVKNLLNFLGTQIEFEESKGIVTEENIETLGSSISCDRPITTGPKINFYQLVNEMYFSTLFNKDEQEPTIDSFQILDKILESEESFQQSKEKGLVDVQGLDKAKLLDIMMNDQPGSYSADAIKIGVKLQLINQYNKGGVSAPMISSKNKNLNKPIESFATLKASSVESTEFEREKCLLTSINLLKMGHSSAFDVAKESINKPIEVQLFKKNQLGGVREISILDIRSRIKTNIVETYFRNLCAMDGREMLTKGSTKFDRMRNNNKQTIGKTKFYFNGDATRWAQSFHTHQFKYLIGCHDTPIKGFAQKIFQDFTEKKLYVPKKLAELWRKSPEERQQSVNPRLEAQKLKYLSGDTTVRNESNMCQGILHYTSSYHHITFLSFLEIVLGKISQKFNLGLKITSQVSSDDYLITITTPIKQSTKITRDLNEEETLRLKERVLKLNITYLLTQTAIIYCQRLFNIHDSSKTSLTNTVYEFNSCFAIRFTFLTPLIKFAVASVEPINTDSPARMISEGINRVNQLIENGSPLELAQIAHRMNATYVQEITGLYEHKLPYEVGVYPDPNNVTELFMFGAKYHNATLISEYKSLTEREKEILSGSMIRQFSDPVEMAANLLYDDVKQHGKIILSTAPSSKWLKLINKLPLSKDDLNLALEENPLIPIDLNPSNETQLIRCCLKAYTSNVRDSLRNTSASIYFARYSAYKTATAFTLGSGERTTFKEALEKVRAPIIPVNLLKDRYIDYDDMITIKGVEKMSRSICLEPRPKTMSKRLNRLRTVTSINHIKSTLLKLLNYKWLSFEPDIRDINQLERDWMLLKERLPFLRDTMSETLNSISMLYDNLSKRDSIALCYKSINQNIKEVSFERKIFSFGFSCPTILDTFRSLYYDNWYSTLRLKNNNQNVLYTPLIELMPIISIYDLFLKYSDKQNLVRFLKSVSVSNKNLYKELEHNIERVYYSFDDQYNRKKLLIMALDLGLLTGDEFNRIMSDQRLVLRQWLLSQKKRGNDWIGPFSVMYFSKDSSLHIRYDDRTDKYFFSMKQGQSWEEDLGLCMKVFLTDFKMTFDDVMRKTTPGHYLYNSRPATLFRNPSGISIRINSDLTLNYSTFKVVIEDDRIKLNDERGSLLSCPITIDPIPMNYIYTGDPKEKIYINGFNINKLLKYQFLTLTFNIRTVPYNDCDFDIRTASGKVKPTKLVEEYLLKLNYDYKSIDEPVIEITETIDTHDIYQSLMDVDITEMSGILDFMNNDIATDYLSEYKDVEGVYGVELSQDQMEFFSKLIQDIDRPIKNELHFRDITRIEEMPYIYYDQHIQKTTISPIQIISILKNKTFTEKWQYYYLIFKANLIITDRSIGGRLDDQLSFSDLSESGFSLDI